MRCGVALSKRIALMRLGWGYQDGFALPFRILKLCVVGSSAERLQVHRAKRSLVKRPLGRDGTKVLSDAAKDLLLTVSREWRRLAFSQLGASPDKDPFGDAYDQVLVSAYEELSAIESQLGQHPSVQTIRVVLMSQLLRLDPVAGDALRYGAEAELAEA